MMVCPHHELAVIDDRIDHGFGTPGDLRRRAVLEARIEIDASRSELESIQQHEPAHARIGAFVRYEYATVKGVEKRFTIRVTTRDVCPRCPSRKACRSASLRLADAETRKIGGEL